MINNGFNEFVVFKQDPKLYSNQTFIGDFNLSLNGRVYDSVVKSKVNMLISDYIFNSSSTFEFCDYRNNDYRTICNKLRTTLKNYKYSVISSKMSSYIMDMNGFHVTNIQNTEGIGTIDDNKIFIGHVDDYNDSKILLFNSKITFTYNLSKKDSSHYLFYKIDLDGLKDSLLSYIVVDDRGNRILARWRDRKLSRI